MSFIFSAIALDENEHLKRRVENLAEDKQSLEKQRNEAVRNLEEMTKNMSEFRNHTKQKFEKFSESEESFKKEIEQLKGGSETHQESLKLKEENIKELQKQIEDLRNLTSSKDDRIQDLNGRLESFMHENELLKESNTITSTALSDVKIELDTLKRQNVLTVDNSQAELFNREITDLKQLLLARESELSVLKRAISSSNLESDFMMPNGRIDSDNIAEPDLHDYSAIEAEKVRLRKQIRELETSLKAKNTELDAVKSQLTLWSSQYDEAKNFINANDCLVMRLERDNQQKQTTIESSRKENNVLKVKIEDAKNEIVTIEGKLKRSQMDYHQLKLVYNECVCKSDNLGKKLEQSVMEFAEKEADYQNHIDQLRQELKELTNNLELLAATVDNKDRTIKELQSHFDVMLPNLESVKGELTSLNSAHNQLKEQSSKLQDEKRTQVKHLESALQVYKDEIEKLKLQLRHKKDTFDLETESYCLELDEMKGKVSQYESQIAVTNNELSTMDASVKRLETEVSEKDGKVSELELSVARLLKEKSDLLEKHSKDNSDFETRFEDLNNLYTSINQELHETQVKLSSANDGLQSKNSKIAQLEELCKDNDSKIKSFIEQLETKSRFLEKETLNKKEAENLVAELQKELKIKSAGISKLTEDLHIAKERYKEIDRTFSDYYQGAQDILNHNKVLQGKVKELQDSLQNTQDMFESTKTDLNHSNEQISILQSLVTEKQVECANKQQKILELEHRGQVALRCREEVDDKVTNLEQKLEKVTENSKDSEQKIRVLEGQLVMKDDQISMRDDKISLLTSKLESIIKLDDSNLKKLEEVTKSASEKSQEIEKVKSENVSYREQLKNSENELSKTYRLNSELDEKVKSLESQVTLLNKSKKSLSEELNLKDVEVQNMQASVDKFETRENKLKVAVTDEITRLKTVVQKLTEEHNKELKEQNEQFRETISAKESHIQKIIQESQQCAFREQILRNDLAQAINQISYYKNNQVYYNENKVTSPNGTVQSADSPTSYTLDQNNGHTFQGHPDERYSNLQKLNHNQQGLEPSVVYHPGGKIDSKFSSITGKGFMPYANSAIPPRSAKGMDHMDKVTEIKSDPMLLNFHFLPHENQQRAMELQSPKEDLGEKLSDQGSFLRTHQTLQRTVSDSRVGPPTADKNDKTLSDVPSGLKSVSKPSEKSMPNLNVVNSRSEPNGLNVSKYANDTSTSFVQIESDVANIFKKVDETPEIILTTESSKHQNELLLNSQIATGHGRTYKVPLANGDLSSYREKQKSKRISGKLSPFPLFL